ncbi:unnamed protein product [Schistocephalus solidus]|uniref:Transmembrane protein n=1 Tax=Schistocephalus solidus TaxID=70667 RepID=A0A183TDJ4_SCHSO|nr:unnamed protein product [Schistocephalus solidus]
MDYASAFRTLPYRFLPRCMPRTFSSRLGAWLCLLLLIFAFNVLVNKFFWGSSTDQLYTLDKKDQLVKDLQRSDSDKTKPRARKDDAFYEYFHPPVEICATVISYGAFMVEFKRLLINTTNIEGKIGGEDYRSVMFQSEESEYVKLSSDTFAVECSVLHNIDNLVQFPRSHFPEFLGATQRAKFSASITKSFGKTPLATVDSDVKVVVFSVGRRLMQDHGFMLIDGKSKAAQQETWKFILRWLSSSVAVQVRSRPRRAGQPWGLRASEIEELAVYPVDDSDPQAFRVGEIPPTALIWFDLSSKAISCGQRRQLGGWVEQPARNQGSSVGLSRSQNVPSNQDTPIHISKETSFAPPSRGVVCVPMPKGSGC